MLVFLHIFCNMPYYFWMIPCITKKANNFEITKFQSQGVGVAYLLHDFFLISAWFYL